MMHGDMKHTLWKRDSGEGAGGSELCMHEGSGDGELAMHDEDHSCRGSEDEDLSQFEDQTFEAESFVSTECPSIRSHYAHTHTTSARARALCTCRAMILWNRLAEIRRRLQHLWL